jgi:hypothetical protein
MKELKYEFESWTELSEAMNHLEKYHNCKESKGKIVCIMVDKEGNDICGYCHEKCIYPHLKKEAWSKLLNKEVK